MKDIKSISDLKSRQDDIKQRKEKLLERFVEFRQGFFESIERLTSEAVNANLEGVKVCKRWEEARGVHARSSTGTSTRGA